MNRTECSRGELQSYFPQNYHKGYLHFLKMEIGMRKQLCRKKRKRAENALLVVWLHGACHPVSGRQKEPLFDTVTRLDSTQAGTHWASLSHRSAQRTNYLICVAAAFGTRVCNEKAYSSVTSRREKKKKNLSGKQVRRQLVWDTCRIHAAHLNLTLSASL